MKKFQLPSDGSVVIVDDKIQEALPLIKLLSQRGIASTYYSGTNDHELPQKPVQKVRLAFFDIQLFPNSDSHTYAQNILTKLDRIIPDNNGPYLLIIWSVLEDVHAATIRAEVTAKGFSKRPAGVVALKKASYFNMETEDSVKNALLESIESSLRSRFSQEDILAIKKAINDSFLSNPSRVPKKNALGNISKALKQALEEKDVLQLFTVWENCINKTSGEIVKSFSSLHDSDEYWQNNLKSTMYRMAHTQLGKKIDSVDDNVLLINAIKTLNQIFLYALENTTFQNDDLSKTIKINKDIVSFLRAENGKKYEIRWSVKSDGYQLYVDGNVFPSGAKSIKRTHIYDLSKRGVGIPEKDLIKHIIDDYLSIEPDINAKLFIDFNVSSREFTGVVYKKSVRDHKRKRILLENYFKPDSEILKKNEDKTYTVKNEDLKEIIFIELDVVPFCDHAQEKWIKTKTRLLPGLMVDREYLKDLKDGDAFYKAMPLLKIDNKCYQCILDFRLLKSEDIPRSPLKRRKPWFKIRIEVVADILSRLSSHASRVGVAFIE